MQFKGRKGCLKVARQLYTTLDTAYPHTVLYACTHAGLKFRDQARGSSRTSFACPGLGGDWGTDRDRALPPCALPAAPEPRALTSGCACQPDARATRVSNVSLTNSRTRALGTLHTKDETSKSVLRVCNPPACTRLHQSSGGQEGGVGEQLKTNLLITESTMIPTG